MNDQLKNLFTLDNVMSYSEACITLSEILVELKNDNYRRLIIPSRGAYPFWSAAQNALFWGAKRRKDAVILHHEYNLWLLPFTSDWGSADISIDSHQIRRFWSKVLADSIRNEISPYTRFYENTVRSAGKKFTINTSELFADKNTREIVTDEKFVFIDTAISGKAITEIIESFHEFNLKDFFIVLIVDEGGKKLKSEYVSIIEREKSQGRLKQIDVSKIFSEDASPLLNHGISSLVFPSLIETSISEIPEFKNNNFVGGGLWFVDAISHLRDSDRPLNGIRGIAMNLVNSGISQYLFESHNWFGEQVIHDVETMIKWAGDFDVFNPHSTGELFENRLLARNVKLKENIEISSSHVVRIDMHEDLIAHIIKETKKV
jgi:hypothetical protein